MEQVISKDEFDELMKLKGEVRSGIKTHGEFILKEEGEKGLKKLEDTILELGYPIKFRRIKATTFYPLGAEAIVLLAIKRLFNYDDEKFQEMGRFHAKSSLIIRLFIKYFVSLKSISKKVSDMWKRYFTVGNFEIVELDEEKKRAILKVTDFQLHPIHCQVFKGSISTLVQMIVGSKVTMEETKCIYRGDEYHEFLLKW
jgi:hypothetical protein